MAELTAAKLIIPNGAAAAGEQAMQSVDVTATTGGAVTAAGAVTAGTLTIDSGSITDSSGALDFGDETLVTTGTLGAGVITGTSVTDGTATLSGGNITGMGNITGTDVDISAGTGDITSATLTTTGDVEVAGMFTALLPHGTFLSTETQAIVDVAAAQAVTFNDNDDVNRLTHSKTVNNSRVTIVEAGSYEIVVSGVYSLAALPADKHMELWLSKNGSDVANSNTRVQLPHVDTEAVLCVSFIFDAVADDYIELMTWGDDTDCQWLATAAGTTPTRPAVPSFIMSVKRISGYPA